MKISSRTTRAELAALICGALATTGDEPVLVGGAVTAIYTKGRYLSDDLDFVSWRNDRERKAVLGALGFQRDGGHWSHPSSPFLVQFVESPVMIGKKHVREPDVMQTPAGPLRILSPLDCALDRFCWYLEASDQQTLQQAANVMVEHDVRLTDVEEWLAGEPYPPNTKAAALEHLAAAVKRRRSAKRKRR